MPKKIGLMDIKSALKDPRFRDSLPIELKEDVAKFLSNPGCACNVPIYRRIAKECKQQLHQYFPNKEVVDEPEEVQRLAENHWSVINCHVDELEARLKKLPPGRKQLGIARHEDQVTVIVNELDIIY